MPTPFNVFDNPPDRRYSDSHKWQKYGTDILPMWIADMDFAAPREIITALHARVQHGIFGYHHTPPQLLETLCERLWRLYRWQITPADILLLPNVVTGLHICSRLAGDAGDEVLIQTPVYPHFLTAPVQQQRQVRCAPLQPIRKGQQYHYQIDLDQFSQHFTANTRLFILCNPHNPVGRAYTKRELEQMLDNCVRHDTLICADEVHAELVLDERPHIPAATLSPDIAQRCITLLSPSKTFNLAGLGISFAVVQNPTLRRKIKQITNGLVPEPNLLAQHAALAAYQHGDKWLDALRIYLTQNRQYLENYLTTHLPLLVSTHAEASFLSWIDCRELALDSPYQYFLENAKVAFNDGQTFGAEGRGFVRLNFGCPRETLQEGLERMKRAIQ